MLQDDVEANVSCYEDEDGNFDMKKFINDVDREIKQKHMNKARQEVQEHNEKFEQKRKKQEKKKGIIKQIIRIVDSRKEVRKYFVSERNKKQDEINANLHKKMNNLKEVVKESKGIKNKVKQQEKKIENVGKNIKPLKKIEQEIDKMSWDEIMIRRFNFGQMEEVKR